MLEFLRRVANLFKDFFNGLTPGRRAALVVTAVVVVTSVSAIFFWAGSTDYQVLGTNLASEDATAIMRTLREKKIPFKVENDGKTIKIPPDAVYDLRLELAAMGLPQAGIVGYEVFDKQSFGTTNFVQKINQKRALEGELMRTINNLKGVKRSRVHLALPAPTTFAEDRKRPTASVVVDHEPGMQLNEKQLNGISQLIAAAVEGMEIGDVTIVDGNGKLLSKNSSDPLAKLTATMLDYQQKKESELERSVVDILTKAVGEGKVVAKVAVELDFTQQTETQSQYDSEGAAVRSEQRESQVMDGSRPLPQGPPGAAANTPGPAPASVTPEVRSNTQKVSETKNYAVPERLSKSTKEPGAIKRMSVAVLLDGLYQKDASKGEDAPAAYQKWSDEKLGEFRAIASSAVGLDAKRGDTIEVRNMEFRREDLENADKQIAAFERKKMIANIIQYSLIGLVIAFFFFFVVRPFIKWLTDNTVESMESFLPKTIEELEKIQVKEENIGVLEEAIPVIVDKVDPEKVEGEMIKEKVITLVENNPGKAAMILHEWIQEPAKNQKQEKAVPRPKRGAG